MFVCSFCDAQSPKWQGRCPECQKWGTFIEEDRSAVISKKETAGKIISFADILSSSEKKRLPTNNQEIDRVLGGGIVFGSLTLIGGEPGIGKSTLALQISGKMPKSIYISGEESAHQIKDRIKRLKINNSQLYFSPERKVEKIISLIIKEKPSLVVIDSIQTIYSQDVDNEPGSVSQIRSCAVKLLEAIKKTNTALLIIGHITKDGQVAGPKTLEHLVDTVIYLEGEEKESLRILRAKKNRFGALSEIGIFQMKKEGLNPIKTPSQFFLEKKTSEEPGMAFGSFLEGSRIFFIETQVLLNKTIFGYPQRKTFGFSLNRLQILSAVLRKKADIRLNNLDIHLNIVGGIKITDPGLDLAVCLAIASAYFNKPLPSSFISMGEVGLGGEIRKINNISQRIKEAKKLGFSKIAVPYSSPQSTKDLILVKNLKEIFKKIF